jgi:hypothetical protein
MTDKTNNPYSVIKQVWDVIGESKCLCVRSPEYDEFVRNEEAMLADIKDPAERMVKLIFSPQFEELYPNTDTYTFTCLRCELLDLLNNDLVDEVMMAKIRQMYRQQMLPEESI